MLRVSVLYFHDFSSNKMLQLISVKFCWLTTCLFLVFFQPWPCLKNIFDRDHQTLKIGRSFSELMTSLFKLM